MIYIADQQPVVKQQLYGHGRFFVPRLFEEKWRDTVFGFPWGVARGAWFRVFSRYFVPLTPPTVSVRSFLKLYRCFKDGLKICMWFFQNPEIIFYHFFRIFNLDIF